MSIHPTTSTRRRTTRTVAVLTGLVLGGIPLAVAKPAEAFVPLGDCTVAAKTTCVFDNLRGREATFTVPDGVAFLDLTLEGGGGGLGASIGGGGGAGGSGRLVSGTLAVKPGDSLHYVVGKAGDKYRAGYSPGSLGLGQLYGPLNCSDSKSAGGSAGAGARGFLGGSGGNGDNCSGGGGGGGGAATVVSLNAALSSPLAVAGGGGGGGGSAVVQGTDGGSGGFNSSTGYAGQPGVGVTAGAGGAVSGGSPGGGSAPVSSGGGGGGGGGGGYPRSGGGGAGSGAGGGGGGGGAAGDSWDGGPANTASGAGAKLLFDTMTMSTRGGGADGRLTISYTTPFVQIFSSATPNPSVYGSAVTYTAVVQSYSNVGVPRGFVRFSVGGTFLCTAVLTRMSGFTDRSTASCQASNAPLGTAPLQTSYSGDITFSRADVAGPDVTVVPAP